MLFTKSFKLSDSDGVNEFLSKFRLAKEAGIFVSNGDIMIPFEDGKPPTKEQQVIEIREQQNTLRSEMSIIEHSNRVVRHLIADAEEKVNVAKAALDKAAANPVRKAAQEKLSAAENARDQLLNQVLMNTHEVNRLQVNIDEYDTAIAKL